MTKLVTSFDSHRKLDLDISGDHIILKSTLRGTYSSERAEILGYFFESKDGLIFTVASPDLKVRDGVLRATDEDIRV